MEETGTGTPADEAERRRLHLLQRMGILDTPPEERFEVFTRLAASVARTPVATISLVDRDRVWFKSSRGLPPGVTEVPRDIAACAHVLETPDDVLVCPDARLDPRFRDSPLVTGEFGMRFYAGAPLKSPTGEVLGSLCIIDRVPRDADPQVIEALRDLAQGVATALRIHEMSDLALKDPLTGLGNRRMFEEALTDAVERARGDGRGTFVATALIDLDRFKSFNDILGHAGGDAVLREAGQRIARTLRGDDVAARLGGDEFVLVTTLPAGTNPEERMRAIADRILAALQAEPLRFDGHVMPLGASIGVALRRMEQAEPVAATVAALLRGADVALYNAKNDGRGRASFFSDATVSGIGSKNTLASDLRRCIQEGGSSLRLVLQPVRRLGDEGAPPDFEALLRWTHEAYGPIPPGSFIPVAERSGIASALDAWVLNEACRIIAGFPAPRPVIAVNVTPYFLVSSDFLATVDACLARHGIAADRLCIEMTERVLLEDFAPARHVTQELIRRGISVALDDFGAGHASFGYLSEVPLTKVKLDRSLTAAIGAGTPAAGRAAAIVRGIIGMCHQLGHQVVVEGVETAAQLAVLETLGADMVQGWHIGRPAPAEDFLPKPGQRAA
ncbi:putative bifunctional diguanylate cyclase/phosphodiesterase [Neoroseomonas rubea]|uniref:putative bifunctional diguanylate cyclase/phosphodiesterase n=1 Tax=Neoroseomonas rubea TaxID=2748666 RepID=UPI0018DFD2E9|nr:sensor domain-containing phosphodiesterase [Roseomonas rubea]